MKVGTILDSKGHGVFTIPPDRPVKAAIRLMKLEGIGCVVVSSDGRTPEGIFSERDVVNHLMRHGIKLLEMPLRRVMATYIPPCAPTDRLKDAMRIMTDTRARHLPVAEDGVLVGIISIGDVVKHRLDELETETAVLRDYIAAVDARIA